VNVSSKCSYAEPNYKALGELLEKYEARGLRVLLFPNDQFAMREEGADSAGSFAACFNQNFSVTEKISINGSRTHPIYTWLKKGAGGFLIPAVKWNFTKFLVNRAGYVYPNRYGTTESPRTMIDDIESLLSNSS